MPVSYCTLFDDNTGRSSSRRLNRGINYKRWPGQDVAHAKGRLLYPSSRIRLTFVNPAGSLPTLASIELKQLTSCTCFILAVNL